MKDQRNRTRIAVTLALLTAIVVILQLLGSFIRFGMFSISLVLIPIVVGAALCGAWAGAWLGLVFGAVVLLSGDAAAFIAINPLGTVLTVIIKGALAGYAAGVVYKALCAKNETLATVAAAVVCPVVNTGVFFLGCHLFFLPTISQWAQAQGFQNATGYIILVLIGGNFLFELLFNIVLSPAIVRIVKLGRKK